MKKMYFIYLIISIILLGCDINRTEEDKINELEQNSEVIVGNVLDDNASVNDNQLVKINTESKYNPIMISEKYNASYFECAYVIGATKDKEWFDSNCLNLPKESDDAYDEYYYGEKSFENDFIKKGDNCIVYNLNSKEIKVIINETTLRFSPRNGSTILSAYFDEFISNDHFLIGSISPLKIYKEKLNYIKDGKNLLELDIDNNGIEDAIFIEESNFLNEDGDSLKIRIRFNDSLIDIDRNVFPSTGKDNDFWLIPIDFNNDNKYELFTYTSMNGMVIDIYELSDKEALNVLTFYNGD